MNSKVDVLAVLDETFECCANVGMRDYRHPTVRAAVAELIEAVKAIPERSGAPCTSEEWAQDDENLGFSHAFFSRAIRSCRSKAYERGLEKGRQLRAAIARVNGA